MAQLSGFWTTSASPVGDQQTGYTQTQLSKAMEVIAGAFGKEGVLVNYETSLSPVAAGANTVQIGKGAAVVDGKWYYLDAASSINIPSAVGGGNTRIDRIVLRADWSQYKTALSRIPGTDAASPTTPAMTQTPGTIYDIPICSVLVNTGGTVTVTQNRQLSTAGSAGVGVGSVVSSNFAAQSVDTAAIADLNVTTGKIANDAVDYTKVGNRVPKLIGRQGGNATDWSVYGSTNYTPAAVNMQSGVTRITWSAGQSANNVSVTYPTAFGDKPTVLFSNHSNTIDTGASKYAYQYSTTASAVTFYGYRITTSGSAELMVSWLAIGKE